MADEPRLQGTEDGTDEPRAATQGERPTENAPADPPRETREIGGPSGPDPTRYGDWERRGRCIDF